MGSLPSMQYKILAGWLFFNLTGSAFKPLADEQAFNNMQVVHGFVSWLEGKIECALEYMYENSYAYQMNAI